MKGLLTLTLTLFLAAVCVPLAFAADEIPVMVMVSPDTLALEAEDEGKEYVLTVHAEIPYSSVADVELVEVEGTNIYGYSSIFPDNRGELVAKFDIPAENLEEGPLKLKLSGTTVGGDTFYGSDTISVIEKNDGGPGSDDKYKNQKGNREGQQD